MSLRSITTTSAAALLLAGAVTAVAAPAQAFPSGWWKEKSWVCTATDRHTGAPLPEITVEAPDLVGAGFYATREYGPDAADVWCTEV